MGEEDRALSQILRARCSQGEKELLLLLRISLGECLCANGPYFSIGNHAALMPGELAVAHWEWPVI